MALLLIMTRVEKIFISCHYRIDFFLTLCRLRHNFGLKNISVRFELSLQSSGVVFNTWISLMYLELGQLCIWPHRNVIISNMPKDFKQCYPTTLVIIDGTEFKSQHHVHLFYKVSCIVIINQVLL